MSIIKTKSFWLAAMMTLICAVAGILLAKLPYVNLIGALVIALLLGIAMQLTPSKLQADAESGSQTSFYVSESFFLVSG